MIDFKTSLIFLVIVLVSGCTVFTGSSEKISDEVKEIKYDHYSNYPEEGLIQKVISSQAEFNMEWEIIHEGSYPLPETPRVNFENRSVILLMLESKPSGGYGITDFEVQENDEKLVVNFSEVRPGDNCILTRAITRPHMLVSISKTDKDIHFQKGETVVRDCSE